MEKNQIREALNAARKAKGTAERQLQDLQARVENLERAAEAAKGDNEAGMTKRQFARTAWVAPWSWRSPSRTPRFLPTRQAR